MVISAWQLKADLEAPYITLSAANRPIQAKAIGYFPSFGRNRRAYKASTKTQNKQFLHLEYAPSVLHLKFVDATLDATIACDE